MTKNISRLADTATINKHCLSMALTGPVYANTLTRKYKKITKMAPIFFGFVFRGVIFFVLFFRFLLFCFCVYTYVLTEFPLPALTHINARPPIPAEPVARETS